jgi:cell division protein FtsL
MIGAVFHHRTRGFRTVNILGVLMVVVLAIAVNLAKAYAARDMREMVRTQRFIGDENTRIRLLKAEVAHLEQPERLQRLAKLHLNMGPLRADQEGDLESIPILVAGNRPPGPVQTPTPVTETPIEISGPGVEGAVPGDVGEIESPSGLAEAGL